MGYGVSALGYLNKIVELEKDKDTNGEISVTEGGENLHIRYNSIDTFSHSIVLSYTRGCCGAMDLFHAKGSIQQPLIDAAKQIASCLGYTMLVLHTTEHEQGGFCKDYSKFKVADFNNIRTGNKVITFHIPTPWPRNPINYVAKSTKTGLSYGVSDYTINNVPFADFAIPVAQVPANV